jgi:hypothetical protein
MRSKEEKTDFQSTPNTEAIAALGSSAGKERRGACVEEDKEIHT